MLRFIIPLITGLCMTGCSITEWSIVHRIDIQQGNVITQDMINRLEPGMTRRQVQYVMGSPMVADVFHQDRWDYIYRHRPGRGEVAEEHVTLHFEDEVLARISGTLRPQDVGAHEVTDNQTTHTVPPQERESPGIVSRFWHWITFSKAEDGTP